MNNSFLLIFFLWIGTLHAQTSSLLTQHKKSSIDFSSNVLRELITTEDFTTTLNFCDLTPGEEYAINIIPADNLTCYPNLFLEQHGLAENQSHQIRFTAFSTCEQVLLSNTCGSIYSTYYYVSILSTTKKEDTLTRAMGIMTDTGEAEDLIRNVFLKGDCVEIDNITYQGNSNALGSFTGGEFAIGIEEGVIITSGAVALASGPNSSTGTTAPWNDAEGDPDLAGTAGNSIMDAAVLEFDFTPTGDMVSFDFVFASEEYCDYVNASFNDAFGFYLTGPGHEGTTNIARVNGPNTAAVSINSVNHLQNSEYYVDNVPPTQQQDRPCFMHTPTPGPLNSLIEYDGFTVKLSAVAAVEPCVPYHIKLAVGDAVDDFFDSAVFLGANSFDASSLVTIEGVVESGDPTAVEGCDDAYLLFVRENIPLEEAVNLTYTISGNSTATEGVDYEPLSGSVTINPGSYQAQVPIIIIPDDLDEGTEVIEIELSTSLCNGLCEQIQTAYITIEDGIPLDVDFSPIPTCGESSVTLAPNIGDGSGDYSYEWSDGSTDPSLDVDLTDMPTTYSVIVTDNSNCAAGIATIVVSGGAAPEATIEGEAFVCEEPASEIFLVNFTGNGPWTLEYSIDGSPQNPITDISDNPYELLASEVGTYTLESVSANNCPGSASGSATIELTELLLTPDGNDVSCGGESDGSASVEIEGGEAPFDIQWSNGDAGADISNLEAGQYTVIVTDNNGCFSETSVEIEEPIELSAETNLSGEPNCTNPMGGQATLTVAGGTEPYTYAWDNGSSDQDLQGVSGGTYMVLVTDNSGCTTTASIEIPAGDMTMPSISIAEPETFGCQTMSTSIILDASASSTGNEFDYNWTTADGLIEQNENTLMPSVSQIGTYTLTVTNTTNGCSATMDVEVEENTSTPTVVINEPANELTCNTTSLILDASNSDNGSDFTYEWIASNGGNIVSGETTLMPEINEVGTYTLTITNSLNNCTSTDFIDISNNVSPPVAVASAADELSCTETEVTLSGSGSDTGANFSYLWSTPNGIIISDETTLTPTVGAVGEYILTVTNTNTGCTETASAFVSENDDLPSAIIAEAPELDCNIMSFNLDATASDNGPEYSFDWEVSNGGVISEGATTLTPTITEPGTYLLTVIDNNSNCESVTSITIIENTSPPDITTPNTTYSLTCGENSLMISANTSVANPSFQWMTEDGTPIAGATSSELEVMESGIYTVQVTDMDNGCTNTEDIPVGQDDNIPTVSIVAPTPLTCSTTSLVLDASASDNGADFTYNWIATDGGTIISGDTTLMPEIGATGTYTLEITNNSNGCSSSDFATVTEEVSTPTAEAGLTLQFACGDTQITLDGTGSDMGSNFTYLWTTDNGVIENDETTLMPTVSAPGVYTITVMNTDNGCTSSDDVTITQDTNAPTAVAGTAESLTCGITSVTLDGSASSTGADFTYLWTTNDGLINNGDSTLYPEVGAAGTYVLTVSNTSNNCTTSSSITVELDDTPPSVAIAQAASLTCGESSVILDGSASDNGPNFTPSWTTLGGNIVSGENTYTPTVDMAGTYILEITNSNNQCSNTSSVEVEVDGDTPTVVIATTELLTCNVSMIELNAQGSDFGDGYTIEWSTDTGSFVEGEETLNPTINAAGNYTLSITNNNNGCTDATNIVVEEDIIQPSVDAGQTQTLDCTVTSLDLEGSTNLDNPEINWTTSNGNILSGASTLTPTVNSAGIYLLTITNPENGCSQSAEVNIALDPSVPEVIIASPEMLNCNVTSMSLDASETTSDQELSFQWTSSNGNIVSGEDTPNPVIDEPGNYVLTILIGDNCSNTSAIIVMEDIEEPIAEAGADFTINCSEPESVLNATNSSSGPNFTYIWETENGDLVNNIESTQPSINGGGLYALTVINTENGCMATDQVTVIDDAPESIQAQIINPDCFNSIGSYGVNGVNGGTEPYIYSIDGGETFQSASVFNDLPAGSYNFVVQDANECTYEETFEIDALTELTVSLETSASVGNFASIELGESLQVLANINLPIEQIESIQWSPTDSLSCSDCLEPTITPSETTTYFVSVTDINGCEVTTSIDVIVDKNVPIYIPSAFSPDKDGNNDTFTIFAENNKIKNINSLQVFNRWGELVFENHNFLPNNFETGWDGSFNGEILNPAVFVYWTEIELHDGRLILMKGDVSIVK